MGKSRTAIVLFTRLPQDEPKFREALPSPSATGLFQRLITHIALQASRLEGVDFLFSLATDKSQAGRDGVYTQRGATIGERLVNLFGDLFGEGYERVIVVGNDCPEVTSQDLETAVRALDKSECVVGPAEDGGCYLIGLRGISPGFLTSVVWHQRTTCADLLRWVGRAQHGIELLDTRLDLDALDDIRRFAARHRRNPSHHKLVSFLDACLSAQRALREGIPISDAPYIRAIEEQRLDWQIPPPVVHL